MKFDFLKNFKGTAIICNDQFYSFNDLYLRIIYYKNILQEYSNKVIAISSDFNFESISLLLAISETSNIAVPLLQTTDQEVSNKIAASRVNVIFYPTKGSTNFDKALVSNENKFVDKPGIILFSSGTTGTPKLILHEYTKIFKIFEKPLTKERDIRILLFLMFDHIGGINTMLNCIKDGSTIVIPSNRNPDYIIDLIFKYKINILPTTPTFLNLMLINLTNNYSKLNSLKLISYGTERMPEQVLLKIKKLLPNVKLLQTFGTSETGILKTISKSSDSLYFKINDDRYSYKIIDNILYLKSELNVSGYINQDSDKFDKDGWYNTGDIVKVDNEGFILVIGRINEVINVGGLKVMPAEIENVLLNLEYIIDVMVYGEFNSITGQMVCAKIVLNEIFSTQYNEIEIKKLIKEHCKKQLEKFKIPVKIYFTKSIGFTNRFKKLIN